MVYPTEEDTLSKSKFNEAFLKMHRIHRLQDLSNMAGINLLAFNETLLVPNYIVKLNVNEGLLFEVWSKLSAEEREEIIKLKEIVEGFIEKNPIYFDVKNNLQNKNITKIDYSILKILKRALFKYETKIRELIGRTGYDSPDYDYDEDTL
jgi:hypothetical protein